MRGEVHGEPGPLFADVAVLLEEGSASDLRATVNSKHAGQHVLNIASYFEGQHDRGTRAQRPHRNAGNEVPIKQVVKNDGRIRGKEIGDSALRFHKCKASYRCNAMLSWCLSQGDPPYQNRPAKNSLCQDRKTCRSWPESFFLSPPFLPISTSTRRKQTFSTC
jgi:hypothetical protein